MPALFGHVSDDLLVGLVVSDIEDITQRPMAFLPQFSLGRAEGLRIDIEECYGTTLLRKLTCNGSAKPCPAPVMIATLSFIFRGPSIHLVFSQSVRFTCTPNPAPSAEICRRPAAVRPRQFPSQDRLR